MENFVTRFVFGISVISLLLPSSSFARTRDRRIQDALAEITSLKRAVAEQDRRLADLQKTVRTLELTTVTASAAMPHQATTELSWRTPSAWNRIKPGMSRAEAI